MTKTPKMNSFNCFYFSISDNYLSIIEEQKQLGRRQGPLRGTKSIPYLTLQDEPNQSNELPFSTKKLITG